MARDTCPRFNCATVQTLRNVRALDAVAIRGMTFVWDRQRRLSRRGVLAKQRGLKTLDELAMDMGVRLVDLYNAPKAEWHHDLANGERVWLYDPLDVVSWFNRKRRRLTSRGRQL